jgi:hypothetical protein
MTVDLERIEELHQADMQASKKGDYRTLRGLMSDDAVVLPPGGRMIRGREALDQSLATMADAAATSEVLEYRFDCTRFRSVARTRSNGDTSWGRNETSPPARLPRRPIR